MYYGHSRRETIDGRHKDRCVMERVPALKLENQITSRLETLIKNPKLLAALVEKSIVGSADLNKEVDQLISAKKTEKQKIDRQLANLAGVLAELPEGVQVKSLLEKMSQLEILNDQVAINLQELSEQRLAKGGDLINSEHVFRIFRQFTKNFKKCPVHEQRDIIRSIIASITISNNGVAHIRYYGSGKYDPIPENSTDDLENQLLGQNLDAKKRPGDAPASQRSVVCPMSGVVEIRRIELLTFGMQIRRSTN